ncbi:MAG: hypothetical protein R3A79_22515 [Nannocystaceae bacterium]
MIGPTAHEATSLQFALGSFGLRLRYALALTLALVGAGVLVFTDDGGVVGMLLIVAAHAFLWVNSQTTAPGGATPYGDETWAPTDEDWFVQIRELEAKGQRWDVTPWDISCGVGFVSFVAVVAGSLVAMAIFGAPGDVGVRLAAVALCLLVPVWFNGMRSNWNPSELRLKGGSLECAAQVARERAGDRFDVVPLLALRDGPRGKYPVDARLMLRPKSDPDGDFIGIQVQVAMNNVGGVDYPYLYCVVLVKKARQLPTVDPRKGDVVFEPGSGDDVRYLVVRQYADNSGGWHTDDASIVLVVTEALRLGKWLA